MLCFLCTLHLQPARSQRFVIPKAFLPTLYTRKHEELFVRLVLLLDQRYDVTTDPDEKTNQCYITPRTF